MPRGYDDALAEKCLKTKVQVWTDEHTHPPIAFRSFNTTGGEPADEEVVAAVQLLITSKGGTAYKTRLKALQPVIEGKFAALGWIAVQAIHYMGPAFKKFLAGAVTRQRHARGRSLSK